mmetsp:Transcript_16695/g.43138  ORF Transcript_16695/g.43138 Transcript_16695/m.43138 type:complete len:209 (-) Transcript_16695:53-679(-)
MRLTRARAMEAPLGTTSVRSCRIKPVVVQRMPFSSCIAVSALLIRDASRDAIACHDCTNGEANMAKQMAWQRLDSKRTRTSASGITTEEPSTMTDTATIVKPTQTIVSMRCAVSRSARRMATQVLKALQKTPQIQPPKIHTSPITDAYKIQMRQLMSVTAAGVGSSESAPAFLALNVAGKALLKSPQETTTPSAEITDDMVAEGSASH